MEQLNQFTVIKANCSLSHTHTQNISLYCMYSMPALGKGMIHVPAAIEGDSRRFHHATQKGMQLKPYELFISGIFHLIFSDHP